MNIRFLIISISFILWLFSYQETKVSTIGSIEGVVRDAQGMPIAQASVYAFEESNLNKRFRTLTDKNGRFVLNNLPNGSFHIHGYKESNGYPDAFFSFFATSKKAWQAARIESGRKVNNVIIQLGVRCATLKLTIEDEFGRPVDATLTFIREDDPTRPYTVGGNSKMSLLVPPVPFRLKVESKGFVTWFHKEGENGKIILIKPQPDSVISITARLKKI